MTILFVLLMFLIVMAINYYTKEDQQPPVVAKQVPRAREVAMPRLSRESGFEIPQGYLFHPGHTWAVDEGGHNARIGVDSLTTHLLGKVTGIEVIGLNRWIRQGQKIFTVKSNGMSVDMVSPVEGVLITANEEVLRNPAIVQKDPYKDGWICVVQSPDLQTNIKNLLRGSFIGPWIQSTVRRITTMLPQSAAALAQDGGVPVSGILAQLEPEVRQAIVKQVFLT